MKRLQFILSLAGLLLLCTYTTSAQVYPLWLTDPGNNYDEYPTSIASTGDYTVTAGVYEDNFDAFDRFYSPLYSISCMACGMESIFVSQRNTTTLLPGWTAHVYGNINNRADVESVPQVAINDAGEVFLSFSFTGTVAIADVSGIILNLVSPAGSGSNIAMMKFDAGGNFIWHIVEMGPSNDYVTDIHYELVAGIPHVAMAGYVEGAFALNHSSGGVIPGISTASAMGSNYGNAFAALYEDGLSNGIPIWASPVNAETFSTDVALEPSGRVYISGFERNTAILAGQPISATYSGTTTARQYFITGFSTGGASIWAEVYGADAIELTTTPFLRASSMTINSSGRLFHAFLNTGTGSGFFPEFGTYVNEIDPSSGTVFSSTTVGTTTSALFAPGATPAVGSPTYSPNIVVDDTENVFINGNFMLRPSATASSIGSTYGTIQINTTTLPFTATSAATASQPEMVGSYTAIINFSGPPMVLNESLNHTYVPTPSGMPPFAVYDHLPATGISQSGIYFYSTLAYQRGTIDIDLTPNFGPYNTYSNIGAVLHKDGFILRSFVSNGFYGKPNTTTDQHGTYGTLTNTTDLDNGNAWTVWPNPVQAHQTLFWKSETTSITVDQIRLMDLTGRTLQTWNKPAATTEGFPLPLGELVPGTYLLEATGENVQQSTIIVVQ